MPHARIVTPVAATPSKVEGEAEVHPIVHDRGEHATTPVPPGNKRMSVLGGGSDAVTCGVTCIGADEADAGNELTSSAPWKGTRIVGSRGDGAQRS